MDSGYITVLRSNGDDVSTADPAFLEEDDQLLARATEKGRVVLTNDRDFVRLARERSHAGVIVFEQGILRRYVG